MSRRPELHGVARRSHDVPQQTPARKVVGRGVVGAAHSPREAQLQAGGGTDHRGEGRVPVERVRLERVQTDGVRRHGRDVQEAHVRTHGAQHDGELIYG